MANKRVDLILEFLQSQDHRTEQAVRVFDQTTEITKRCANIQSDEIIVKQVMTKTKRTVGAIRKTAERKSGSECFWSQWRTLRRPYR
jgi:hypothetical protein